MKRNTIERKETHSQRFYQAHHIDKQASEIVYDPTRHRRVINTSSNKNNKKNFLKKKYLLFIPLLALLPALFIVFHIISSGQRIIQRNSGIGAVSLKNNFDTTQLKGEGEGRVNILLLGIGDTNHQAANLSDTNIVLSLDPINKDIAMVSLPRDLYVSIPGYGYDKLNAAHLFGEEQKDGSGPDLAKKVVESIIGQKLHYYIKTDFSGLVKAIDILGGVDINVEESIYDNNYPCDYNENLSCVFSITKGVNHLDGKTALKYARSRYSTSDFDRAHRQQQILVSAKNKALQVENIFNIVKISQLLDNMGDHVRTDLSLDEIRKLGQITKDINQDKIINVVIDDSPESFLVSGQANNGAYILRSKTGNWVSLQKYMRSIFIDHYIKQENARIMIKNGTSKPGYAKLIADDLASFGYNVVGYETADNSEYTKTKIINHSGNSDPISLKYLKNRFQADVTTQQNSSIEPSNNTSSPYDIEIIIGSDYNISNESE